MSFEKEVENSFINIINDEKLDSKAKSDKILKLLQIDNTNENIVFEYLKLQKELLSNSNDDLLKKLLLQFECCIEEKKFNDIFQIKKISYKKRIMNLISLIKDYIDKIELDDKIELLEKIKLEKVENFHNLVPINYKVNLELYLYSLYYDLYERIINLYKNNFPIKNEIESYIKKNAIEKSKLVNSQNNQGIDILDKKMEYIPYIYGTFNQSLEYISTFIARTYNNFYKRFEGNQFKDEKELLLFADYMFFLSHYKFGNEDRNYVHIWNDTFIDLKIEDKNQYAKGYSLDNYRFKINDNILNIERDRNESYSIENIDDYSFLPLVKYLSSVENKPDLIELNRFLKIDKYMDKLYIRKIWNYWEKFLLKLFSSNVVKSLFIKIFNNENEINKLNLLNFIDKKEIESFINKIRYYIFESDFHGMILEKNLSVYENGDPYFIRNNALLSKIAYLGNNALWNLYIFIERANIRLRYYLSNDERFTPPKPEKFSKTEKLRNGIESEEFIKQILSGFSNGSLELEQMLYILDIKNYDKEIDKFKEDFMKFGKEKGYDISPEFKNFLSQLDINVIRINFESIENLCFIQRYKYKKVNNNYGRHPSDGLDDIYDIINSDLV